MKYLIAKAILAAIIFFPSVTSSQSKGKVVHVYESGSRKMVTGRVINVSDSSILVVRNSPGRDTVLLCCNEIYSIKPRTSIGESIASGALNGTLITIMVADNQRRESGLNSLQTEWTSEAYFDALTGTAAGLILEVPPRKEPIIIDYSYERFRAYSPEILQMVGDKR